MSIQQDHHVAVSSRKEEGEREMQDEVRRREEGRLRLVRTRDGKERAGRGHEQIAKGELEKRRCRGI